MKFSFSWVKPSCSVGLDGAPAQQIRLQPDHVGDGDLAVAVQVRRLKGSAGEGVFAQQMGLQPDHIGDGDPAVAAEVAGDHGGQGLEGLAVPGIGDGHAGAHKALALDRQGDVVAGGQARQQLPGGGAHGDGPQIAVCDAVGPGGDLLGIALHRLGLKLGGEGDVAGDGHAAGVALPAGEGVGILAIGGADRGSGGLGDGLPGGQLPLGIHRAVIVQELIGILPLIVGIEGDVAGPGGAVGGDLLAALRLGEPAHKGAALLHRGGQGAVFLTGGDQAGALGAGAAAGVEGHHIGAVGDIEPGFQAIVVPGGVFCRDDQGIASHSQPGEGHGVIQPGQVIALGIGGGGGGGDGVGAVGAEDGHRHLPDVIGVAQGAPEGEARLPHRQGGVHRGIGRAVQGPAGPGQGQLPLQGGFRQHQAAAGGVGGNGQIAARAPVLQGEAAVIHGGLPQLALVRGGFGQGDAVFTGGEPQAVFLAGDGIVAAGVIVQAELLIFAAGDGVQGQARGAGGGRQAAVGGGAQLIHALAHRGVLEAVVRQHHLGLGGLIDPQAGVYAQLHVAGVAVVILQHLAGDAVFVGGGAGHHAPGVGLRLPHGAAFVVNGLDELGLRLIGKAAQSVEGPHNNAGSAAPAVAAGKAGGRAHAVLHGTGPEHVAQGDAVVIHVKAGNSGLNGPDDGVIVAAADIVALHPHKTVAVLVGQGPPGGVEAGAIAPVGLIGSGQPVADGAVICIGGGLTPPEEGPGNVAAAGELIRAVGLAACIARAGGNDPRAAGLEPLAQGPQQLLLLVVGGGG